MKSKTRSFDAILVLGVSIKKSLFRKRVEKAASLYHQGVAPKIIFSGRFWGGFKKYPNAVEAKLMKKYALELGVPSKDIFTEERSLNTAGNFYFTKQEILRPKNIKRLIVITRPDHFSKSKYLAKKILGPLYHLKWVGDGTKIKKDFVGHLKVSDIKKFFDQIKDGDDKAIAILLRKHPHYSRYRII